MGGKPPNGAAAFSFATRVEFCVHTSGRKQRAWELRNSHSETTREVVLSSQAPHWLAALNSFSLKGSVISGGLENLVGSLSREENNKGNIGIPLFYSFLTSEGRTKETLNALFFLFLV